MAVPASLSSSIPGTLPVSLPGTLPVSLPGTLPVSLPGTLPVSLPVSLPGSVAVSVPGSVSAPDQLSVPAGSAEAVSYPAAPVGPEHSQTDPLWVVDQWQQETAAAAAPIATEPDLTGETQL